MMQRLWQFIRLTFLLLLSAPAMELKAQGIAGWQEQKALPASDSIGIASLLSRGIELVNEHTDSAIILLREAASVSERLHYGDGVALALMGLSSCAAVRNDIPAATRMLHKAYPYCIRSASSTRLLVKWYRNQFIVHKYAGRPDSAMTAIQKVMPLLDRLNDTAYVINTYNHIGSILIDNEDYAKAVIYIRKAWLLNEKINADKLVSAVNMGYVYAGLGNADSLFLWATRAYEGARKLGIARYERSASLLLVKAYLGRSNKMLADDYARHAIALMDRHASDNQLYVYRVLSKEYFDRGYHKEAQAYGQKALESINPEHRIRKDIIYLYAHMASVYQAMGQSAKAYRMLSGYNVLSDSLNLKERAAALDRAEQQFRLAEKEKEIVLKQNELLKQQDGIRRRNVWIAVAIGGVLLSIILLVILQRAAARKMEMLRQQKEIHELKAMIAGEEKERSRMAIELHDNVGALLSAAAYGIESAGAQHSPHQHGLQKVDAIIREIRSEIRKTAHTLMPDVLVRSGLADAVRQYCAFIEQDTGLQIVMQEQGSFEAIAKETQLSIYRIVQELLQNIQKHAMATKALVQLHAGSGIVSLTVEDNGKGMALPPVAGGRGLQNIEQRLKVMAGNISFDSEPGKGTSVYIELIT